MGLPLPTLLSQALVAFTIGADHLFERRVCLGAVASVGRSRSVRVAAAMEHYRVVRERVGGLHVGSPRTRERAVGLGQR